jgi:hypothetical protein
MDKQPFRKQTNPGSGGRKTFKNFGFVALIILIGLITFAALSQPSNLKEVPFSQVIS